MNADFSMRIDYLDIEVTEPEVSSRTKSSRLSSIVDVRNEILNLLTTPFYISISSISGNVDRGQFLIWGSEDRALVRLHEHREWYASDPSSEKSNDAFLTFFDSDAKSFKLPYEKTVPLELAIQSIDHWLERQEKSPILVWSQY